MPADLSPLDWGAQQICSPVVSKISSGPGGKDVIKASWHPISPKIQLCLYRGSPLELQSSAPRLQEFRPRHIEFRPLMRLLTVQFRPYWCPIKTSVQPLLVGKWLVTKTPSNWNFDTTFLWVDYINRQSAFSKCVLYLVDLVTEESYWCCEGPL